MSIGADPRGSGQPGANPSYRVVRELGKRAQRSWAAVREKNELVVVQRFTKKPRPASGALGLTAPFGETAYDEGGAAYVAADAMGIILRDARCLSKNWHPNVSRVRHVDLFGEDLTIATELIEGATLADLIVAARSKRANEKDPVLPFPLLARVIVDVLGGLHGLHGLRDGMNAALNVFHAELCPANIVIGKDGVARISHVFRPRPVKIDARSEGLGYAAPEALGGEPNQDARADIYSVGAILWEGLTGRRLFEESDPLRVAQRQREEDLEPPSLPASSAFARLSEATTRALAFDPSLRFRTASEMATEIRRIAGTRLAPGSAVAQTVMELAGDRIRARRTELDQSSSGARRAFGAASIPPTSTNANAKKLEADTTPKAEPQRDTQIIVDDGEKTQVDDPAPLTTRAGSDPMIAEKKPAASPTPAPVQGTTPDLAPPTPGKLAIPRATPAAPKAKEAPKVAPTATALALAASKDVALAEKSLVDATPLLVQPPLAPFPLTPSAAPPSSKAPNEPDPIIVMPKLPASPFPLTPSARPPALPKMEPASDVFAPSERMDVTSVDVIESERDISADSTNDLSPPAESSSEIAEAKRESGAEPASGMALTADDAESDTASAQRRKKMTPVFAAVAGLLVLVLVVAGIASLTGSNDSKGDGKTGAASSGATTTTTAMTTTTATATETTPPAKTEETPTPEPTPEPAAVAPPPEPTPAPAPKPKPTAQAAAPPAFVAPSPAPKPAAAAPAPAKKPKKSSYEPSGI